MKPDKNTFESGKLGAFLDENGNIEIRPIGQTKTTTTTTTTTTTSFNLKLKGRNVKKQKDAPWGLARISHRKPHHSSYMYFEEPGRSVCVYALDSGLDESHPEFFGRAEFIKDFTNEGPSDNRSHGTHAAGIIGSTTYGVAKKAFLLGVKVINLDGTASASKIIDAMDFIVRDADTRKLCTKGVVVYTPLYSSNYQPLVDASKNMVQRGIFLVAAASDEDEQGVTEISKNYDHACVVGATTRSDELAPFSMWNQRVNVLAPGFQIPSTVPDGRTALGSGTPQAAAHVAGLGAYLLGLGISRPDSLCKHISKNSLYRSTKKRKEYSGVPKKIVNNGFKYF
ncbi:hypothetical protein QQS21_012145 [Conoideocrella luteorostrata]|uniref:Peptidase S8/S53 domain-containing protein n=1 Tax=Conoideocrella luteorostrata TaxID=1105319 RepID=A0AAJ0CGA4_9HYPO|nr:hypothetical protein QQS21_012145 [Conoideocrella luteorostrata]